MTLDACVTALRELRPGSVTVFALGHEGWARCPGTVVPAHPGLKTDPLAIWRQACDQTKTPLFLYISTLINYRLAREHPEFARWYSNNNIAPQRLDHNAACVEQRLLPFIDAVMERYRPQGIWLDGDFWSVFPSWNPASVWRFETETGLNRPADFGDRNFDAYWRFTQTSHGQYVARIADTVQRHDPRCALVVNSAYTLRQPESPPPFIGRINIDPPLFFGMESACLETRFAGRSAAPFDVVLGSNAEPEGVYYAYPKSDLQLAQEAATVLASGGNVKVYVPVRPTGGFELTDLRRIKRILADFCLPRQAVLQPSESMADIAILHLRDHFDRTHRLDEVRGAALALLRSNRHFDILDERSFIERSREYRVAVVAEQGRLSADLASELKRFVGNGGGLVLSLQRQTASATVGKDALQAQLADLVPIRVDGVTAAPGRIDWRDEPIGVPAGALVVRQAPKTPIACDLPIKIGGSAVAPPAGRLRLERGKGRICVLPWPAFDTFGQGPDPRLRALLADSLDWALGDAGPRLRVTAPPWIEVAWRRIGAKQIIHLVNHARGAEFRPRASVVGSVPAVRDVRITLRIDERPADVTLYPRGRALQVDWLDDTLTVVVRQVDLHAAVVITAGTAKSKP